MIGAVAVGFGVAGTVGRRVALDPVLVIPFVGLAVVVPVPTAALVFLGWSISRFRRAAASARERVAIEHAATEVGDLVGLGLAGGYSTAAAVRLARDHCTPAVIPAMDGLLDRMDRLGVVPALATETGVLSGVAGTLATATSSGAPVLPALEAQLRQVHHRRHMAAVERSRRLPVRLLVPLTLLVLPGFVLITVGPAVVDSLARLSP